MYQAHYLTDKGIKSYLRTVNEELYRKHRRLFLNKEKHIEGISRIVFNYFNIPLEMIKEKNRNREFIVARQFTAYFIRKELAKITLKEIGSVFNLNHATVIHSLRNINDLVDVDSEYQKWHKELNAKMIELYK